MLRSLFTAISGLQAHQTKLDVVGNNIANVNTVGFKSSQTVFEDTLSQVLRNGSAPTSDSGGTNPAQVGLGVKVAGISTNFSQGSTQSTGNPTDFLISGDGFFITKSGNEQLYTRAGSFNRDGSGKLVTPDGSVLQGWAADANGVVDTNKPVGSLTIPFGGVLAPSQTSASAVGGNLSANNPAASQTQATVYDALGNPHQMSYVFTPSAASPFDSKWTVDVKDEKGAAVGSPVTLTFDATTGAMTAPATRDFAFTPTGTNWPSSASIKVDLAKLSQFGGPTTEAATTPAAGAGSALGTLDSFSLSDDGTIIGLYSNGQRQKIGQLALANFTNPGGLQKAGDSSYRAGDNSGSPQIGQAGAGGRGTLSSGALEMSNVDLAQEFTGLIIAQRGFQANSKVITTSDQILQELVNLKQ